MDIKIPYSWLQEWVDLKNVSAREFARRFSLSSMTVDRVEKVRPRFKKVVTAKILSVVPHPDANKLKVATVMRGKQKLKVVCGAPNIAPGQTVPLALDGAKVVDSKNPEKTISIRKATIRGVKSNGMLCSPLEIGMGDNHDGIYILPPRTPLGKPLEDVLRLEEDILHIEVTTNRPDCMSIRGLAREAAAVFNKSFIDQTPKPKLSLKDDALPFKVNIKVPDLCARWTGIVLRGAKVRPSPLWLQQRLIASGFKPINNVVDITNYVLVEYGRPNHSYDYKKLKGNQLNVRMAKRGEKITALDNKRYKLDTWQLVGADAKEPAIIAGVMGGLKSGVTENSTDLVIEAATWEPSLIRKMSQDLNLRSESSNLFEKDLPSAGTEEAVLRVVELCQELTGAQVASELIDVVSTTDKKQMVKLEAEHVSRYVGVDVAASRTKEILSELGFKVTGTNSMSVLVPWWRSRDISIAEDLIEEVARIYGYHNVPATLPSGQIKVSTPDPLLAVEDSIKDMLSGIGFTEVFHYSMQSAGLIKKMKLNIKDHIKLANPLNEDLVYMRTDLLPQMLATLAVNEKTFRQQHIFELSNVYLAQGEAKLPKEESRLVAAVLGTERECWQEVRGIVEHLLTQMRVSNYQFVLNDDQNWHSKLSLAVEIGKGKKAEIICRFGIVDGGLKENFGIKQQVGLITMDVQKLAKAPKTLTKFTPLPAYPEVTRDIALVIEDDLPWIQVENLALRHHALIDRVEYLSTFSDASVGAGKKSLAIRLFFRAPDRTLTINEVDKIYDRFVLKLEEKLGAKLR